MRCELRCIPINPFHLHAPVGTTEKATYNQNGKGGGKGNPDFSVESHAYSLYIGIPSKAQSLRQDKVLKVGLNLDGPRPPLAVDSGLFS